MFVRAEHTQAVMQRWSEVVEHLKKEGGWDQLNKEGREVKPEMGHW